MENGRKISFSVPRGFFAALEMPIIGGFMSGNYVAD